MLLTEATTCSVCSVPWRGGNDWTVAITVCELYGVMYVPAHSVELPLDPDKTYELLCSHSCAGKHYSRALDDWARRRRSLSQTDAPDLTPARA